MAVLRTTGMDVGNVSAAEIVALARAQIGLAWSPTGCAMFAVGIADAAGASYADDTGVGDLYSHYERTIIPDTISAITPRAGNYQLNGFQDNASGVWETAKFGAGLAGWDAMKAALRPGDIVRLWGSSEANNQTSNVHSFIVASVSGSTITVIDNTGAGGNIREHTLTNFSSGGVTGLFSAYVSHLKISDMTSTALNDILLGSETADNFAAGSGNDRAYGRGGNDSIFGDAGNDVLRGGAGSDSLLGGTEADNVIGGSGNDRLYGGTGVDTLSGNDDADTFYFKEFGTANADRVTDFYSATETIYLYKSAFTGLGTIGVLTTSAFVVGTVSADSSDRVIYDKTTGRVFYDADGTGIGSAQLVCTLENKPTLTASDFYIYL